MLPIIKPEDKKQINTFMAALKQYEYIIKQRANNIKVTFNIR